MEADRIAALAKTAQDAIFAVARAEDPAREAHRQSLLVAFDAAGVGVSLNDFTSDDYPRDGCSIVLVIRGGKFDMHVFAPTYVPYGGRGLIESYMPVDVSQIGPVVAAFAKGEDVRFAGRGSQSEDQSPVSGSSVTL